MKYLTGRPFTLPASAGHRSTCDAYGHTFADVRGKCVRCGDPKEPPTMGGVRSIAEAMGRDMYGADGSHPEADAIIDRSRRAFSPL